MSSKIFCWVNSGKGSDWQVVIAMAEDGTSLASHVSSLFNSRLGLVNTLLLLLT